MKISCVVCGEEFGWLKHFLWHVKEVHGATVLSEEEAKWRDDEAKAEKQLDAIFRSESQPIPTP